ncbi:MAG: tetratricopeptide repeat protein [Cyanobacteria bacterium P01_E01_bin.48]
MELVDFIRSLWANGTMPLPVALGLTIAAMTTASFLLLNETSKEEVAIWLQGGYAQGWAGIFTSLFDALFGKLDTRLQTLVTTLWRSALASLTAVALMWWLMGGSDLLGSRSDETLSILTVLTIALVVNVLVDYVSLQETRWLLGLLPRLPLLTHPLVLLLDLVVTGALIWGALWTWQRIGWHAGETAVFGEVAGGFSMLTVFFYSTFLTSVWSWAFVLSTILMRLAMVLRLDVWSSVDTRPGLWLGLLLGVFTALLSTPISFAFRSDPQTGLAVADRALCTVFPGPTCRRVINLTTNDAAKLAFLLEACEWGVNEQCLRSAFDRFGIDDAEAASIWLASCNEGDGNSCTALASAYHRGTGLEGNIYSAITFYERGCNAGDPIGCFQHRRLFFKAISVSSPAVEHYLNVCRRGSQPAICYNFGFALEKGLILQRDLADAAYFYGLACDESHSNACLRLGSFLIEGKGVDEDRAHGERLHEKACELGLLDACERVDPDKPVGSE